MHFHYFKREQTGQVALLILKKKQHEKQGAYECYIYTLTKAETWGLILTLKRQGVCEVCKVVNFLLLSAKLDIKKELKKIRK